MYASFLLLSAVIGVTSLITNVVLEGFTSDNGAKEEATALNLEFEKRLAESEELTVITDQEITEVLQGCNDGRCLVSDVTVTTSPDGLFTFSGVIQTSTVREYINQLELSQNQLNILNTLIKTLPTTVQFKASAHVSGVNDVVSLSVQHAELEHLAVPSFILSDLSSLITDNINSYLDSVPGVQVKLIGVTDDGLVVEGNLE